MSDPDSTKSSLASASQLEQEDGIQNDNNLVLARLQALPYHEAICEHFETHEPKVWEWFSDLKVLEKSFADTRDALLKNTYRLSPESHETVYQMCHLAMQRLGIEAPVTLYQANDGAMNAALFYVPNEVHIAFYGPLLDKLSDNEVLAILGHELSHYLLWSMQDSRYLIAQQVLEDSVAKAPYNNALYESARIYALNTETFADRGGVIAAQDEKYSIAVLIKVMTGLRNVDPTSFLQQAKELDEKGDISDASSHPELYLRALLMQKWRTNEDNLEQWIEAKLKGSINIHCLDLLDQTKLTKLTKAFFHYILDESGFASIMVLTQVQDFFPKWKLGYKSNKGDQIFEMPEDAIVDAQPAIIASPAKESASSEPDEDEFISSLNALELEDSTKDYFIALLFDIAHADKEQTDEVLIAGADIMQKLKWHSRYRECLKSILKLPKTKIDKLIGKAHKEVTP